MHDLDLFLKFGPCLKLLGLTFVHAVPVYVLV